MADVYATITDADPALVTQIAQILELRAADPQQAAMRQTYLGDIAFPDGARVLEVGCGTGAVTRELAGWPSVPRSSASTPPPPSWPTPADTTRPPRCGSWRATPLAQFPDRRQRCRSWLSWPWSWPGPGCTGERPFRLRPLPRGGPTCSAS